jgi:glycosyltransferase involved in cell wall biosynthesis
VAPKIQKKDFCVLIPAYNEELKIARLAEEVRACGFFLLVIDDGSRDRTAEMVMRHGIECVRFPENQGKGAALREGFRWFLASPYQAVIMMDSDGQHDPKDLDLFVEVLGQNDTDLVIGNRMGHSEAMPPVRRATNRLMSWVISAFIRRRVPDTQCGYRAIRKEALKRMNLRTNRFEIESEILLEAGRLGLAIGSVPIRSVYAGRKSHINPVRDTFRFFKFILQYLIVKK